MSDLLELRLEHEQPALDGLITFDGRVVESFGFNDVRSVRLSVGLLEGVSVSFKSGMLAQPHINFQGGKGTMGYNRAIEPPDEQQPEVENFVAAVNDAIQEQA